MGIRYLVHSKRSKNTEQPKQALAIEQAKDSTSTVLEGEIVGVDDPWPDFNGERLDTDELPVFGRYPLDDEPPGENESDSISAPSHRQAHIRFFVEYAVYTAVYVGGLAVIAGLSFSIWNANENDRLRLFLILGAMIVALLGLWPLSVMLRRADAKWDDATAPPPVHGVPYPARQKHISLLAHSILLQAGIWIVVFVVASWFLNMLNAAGYWHFLTQVVVTFINAFFIKRTLVEWQEVRIQATDTEFTITRPDILWLFLTGDRSVNVMRRTLIGSGIGERSLTERFAYGTRGTIILKTQQTESNGETVVQRYPYISGIESLAAALRSEPS